MFSYIVNKSGDQRALDYLRAGTEVDFWRDLNLVWKAPYHSTFDERNAALASACVLGLGIAGERGIPILEDIVSVWEGSENIFFQFSLASAKSALNDARTISNVGLAEYYGEQK